MNLPASVRQNSSGILPLLEALISRRGEEVAGWMEKTRARCGVPFYSSVDLRHAGFKLAPVDTNLFPAGFNHLSPAARARAARRMRARFAKTGRSRVLIIPENHTRNQGYLDNLHALATLVAEAGAQIRIGSLIAQQGQPIALASSSGDPIAQQPLIREKNTLRTEDGFTPDLILLNNDLTSGLPERLRGVTQKIEPRPSLGWHRRRKSIHFDAYDKLAQEFAQVFDLDPWLFTTEAHKCGRIDFASRQGLDCVAMGVEKVLHRVRIHYRHYGIVAEPYVFIKSDAGTYGMGIMTVRDPKDLADLNRRARNKMSVIKDGQEVTEVILQEGVPTFERVNDAVAEPVVYMIDRYVVGGFYRVNAERGIDENLNSPGAAFVPLAFAEPGHLPRPGVKPGASAPNRFYMYGVIARLAMLAASYELEATDPDAEIYA
jgi:glutamate--cysteine ligase